MSNNHDHSDRGNSNGASALATGLVILAVIGYVAYKHLDAVLVVANQYFKLPPMDVAMIPVGAVLFFCLWKILELVLFKSYQNLLEERDSASTGALTLAADLQNKAQGLRRAYEEKMSAVRVSATRYKMAEVNRAKDKAGELNKQAQDEAQAFLAQARAEIQVKAEQIRSAAMARVDELADEVVNKAIVPPAAPEHFLQ